MVPVPDAILAVLKEAARIVVHKCGSDVLTTTTESLDLYDHKSSSMGRRRMLARDIIMPPPGYPPYRASVMDGYALSTHAYNEAKEDDEDPHPIRRRLFRVIRKVHAGDDDNPDNDDDCTAGAAGDTDNAHAKEEENQRPPAAYYVTTGAVVPDGCDCVVPLEDVNVILDDPTRPSTEGAAPSTAPTVIELLDSADVRPGRWIRAVGFDVPPKSVVATAGQLLDSTMVGLLRQAGLAKVDVLPLVRVGVLSTGNELVDDPAWSSSSSAAGRIPDVNRPVLMSLYGSWNNCEIIDLGIVQDSDDGAIRHALTSAIANRKCQVIVTTGGISMGEMDRMEPVLQSLHAHLHFGRLHMKPGKPTTLATLPDNNHTLVFCLPGNPVSAAVCSHLLVRPCLDLLYQAPLALSKLETSTSAKDLMQRLVEEMPVLHPEVPVTLQSDVVLDAERPEYHRVQLRPNVGESGTIVFDAHSTGVQQSSRLASMRNAHALVLLPQASSDQRKVTKGTALRALLLDDSSGIFPRLRLAESHHMKQCAGIRTVANDVVEPLQSPSVTVASAPRLLAVELVLVRCVKPTDAESIPPNLSELVRHVEQALSNGPTFSSFTVVTSRTHTYAIDAFSAETVWDEAIRGGDATNPQADVQIVAYEGPLVQQLRLAKHLTTVLSKLAPALAMDARQGIAAESSTAAALFDVVVGVADAPTPSSTAIKSSIDSVEHKEEVASPVQESPKSCQVFLLLPLQGLSGALSSIRRQIRHAVKVAQQSQ
jgi:molybdenum cofactor synthesis domain-containing protein